MIRRTLLVFMSLCTGAAAIANEEPEYDVIERREVYEVRSYRPYIVAETTVGGGFEDSGNAAFGRLFGYISGANRRSEKMAMTAPVTSAPSEKIAMTAPVLSADSGAGSADKDEYVYQFIMPAQYDFDELPRPTDATVTLRKVPAKTVAALRYSGFWSEKRYRKHEKKLLEALEADGIVVRGQPVLARYNGPFTPWFLRRNEVLVEIDY